MNQEQGSLTVAQARALRALDCGGALTERQVRTAARLTGWEIRRVIANLHGRGLIAHGGHPDRFQITRLGQNTLATKPSTYGNLRPDRSRQWAMTPGAIG
ncbi:hypothetical protein GCM10027089_55280 [Nocardia thraciensis]